MRTLHRYITTDLVVAFLLTLSIFTFVMCAAAIVKAIDLMTRGLSGWVILKVFLYNMPYILTFSIPMSLMTTTLLLFSRLSFDGEITAMKACGLSLWQIIAPVVLTSIVLSGVCLYLNSSVAPNSRYARQMALHSVGISDPMALLDEGRFVRDFPGLMIYIGKKDEDRIEDIVVYETGETGVRQNIRAKYGTVGSGGDGQEMTIDLFEVRIDRPDAEDPMDPSKARSMTADRYPVTLDLSEFQGSKKLRRKTKDQTTRQLMNIVRNASQVYKGSPADFIERQRTKKMVAANKRMALSMSCFSFVLLAIPLGMRSKRKESSVGVAISLGVVFIFYSFMIFAESVVKLPHLRPEILIWVPVVVAQLSGLWMIHRIN